MAGEINSDTWDTRDTRDTREDTMCWSLFDPQAIYLWENQAWFWALELELVMREWHWWTWYQFGRVLKLALSMGGYCWYRRTYYSLAQVLYLVQVGAGYAHNMRLQAVSCHPHSTFPLSPRPLQPCYPFQIASSLSFITRGALLSFKSFWLKPFCGCCSMVELC